MAKNIKITGAFKKATKKDQNKHVVKAHLSAHSLHQMHLVSFPHL